MTEVKMLRDKTGMKQADIALYLGVSRSLVKAVEANFTRSFTGRAAERFSILMNEVYAQESSKKKVPVAKSKKPKTIDEKMSKHARQHNLKAELLIQSAEKLAVKLNKVKEDHAKAERLSLMMTRLLANQNAAYKKLKKASDHVFLNYHLNEATAAMLRNGADAQLKLQMQIELQLGYAEVHRRISAKFR